MLGFNGIGVGLVFLLCILSTFACIAYGLLKWNQDGNDLLQEAEKKWEEEEQEIEENL